VEILKRIAELRFRHDFGPQSVRPSFELDENRHTVTLADAVPFIGWFISSTLIPFGN
jgi:hypothetical protein